MPTDQKAKKAKGAAAKKKGGRTTAKKVKEERDESPASTTQVSDQTLEPTSIKDWKREPVQVATEVEGFIAELPSGNVVRMVRTMDMPLLLKTGQIPNPLAGIVQGMIDSRTTQFPFDEMDTEVMMQLLDLLHETVVRSVIEPPFSMPAKRIRKGKDKETPEAYMQRLEDWEPDPDTISVWDMDMSDRFFIFAVAQGAAADLASFREEQDRALADLQASAGVRDATQRAGGARSE